MSQEIARREAALKERERNIERLGSGERPNNFPPFPKFCPAPFKPCFYLNIKVEVPPSEQWKVYVLLGLLICKSLNSMCKIVHKCTEPRYNTNVQVDAFEYMYVYMYLIVQCHTACTIEFREYAPPPRIHPLPFLVKVLA